MKSKRRQYFLITSVIAILVLVTYFGVLQSVVPSGTLQGEGISNPVVRESVFSPNDLELRSTEFGTTTSSAGSGFCGDTSGQLTISNSYSINPSSSITIISSMQNDGRECVKDEANYVSGEVLVGAGTITARCDSQVSGGGSAGDGVARCLLRAGNQTFGGGGDGANFDIVNAQGIILTKPTLLEFRVLTTSTKPGVYSYARLELDVSDAKPQVVEEEEPTTQETPQDTTAVECTSNIQCIDECGTQIPTCTNNVCQCGEEQTTSSEEKTPVTTGTNNQGSVTDAFNIYSLIPVVLLIMIGIIGYVYYSKGRKK